MRQFVDFDWELMKILFSGPITASYTIYLYKNLWSVCFSENIGDVSPYQLTDHYFVIGRIRISREFAN